MRHATTVEPPGRRNGGRRRGFGKRVCASKSSQYLCNRIVSPYEESLLGKQGEKKIRRGERKRAVPKGGRVGRKNGGFQGGGGGERGERRRIMKTTMGERALLKLVQFCSRRRARTTTMAVVVAAQYCV